MFRNIYDVNIQEPTTLEVADTEIMMNENENLDLTPAQNIEYVCSGRLVVLFII